MSFFDERNWCFEFFLKETGVRKRTGVRAFSRKNGRVQVLFEKEQVFDYFFRKNGRIQVLFEKELVFEFFLKKMAEFEFF